MFFAVSAQPRFWVGKSAVLALALGASVVLAGCQNKASITGSDGLTTGSIGSANEGASFKKTEQTASAWKKNPGNAEIGLAYAGNLQQLGQQQMASQVLQQVAQANQDNAAVLSRTGKAFLTTGDAKSASTTLERAATLNPNDWQTLSALGSAYDQQARYGEARDKYQQALAINPAAVGVRNNLAMSHALQGNLSEAEKMLRELMNSTGSDATRVRQNLALVVGLQGRFEEARKIASEDLPPEEVDANLRYLQQMLAQPDTWKQLQENQG
jgi:Flp pilus assembly protein TadD